MPEPEILIQYILKELAFEKDLIGKNILVSAGATKEFIDPVRFISNPSTGKMGIAIAKACMLRGANVTLVYADIKEEIPMFINSIKVDSAKNMFEEIKSIHKNFDIIFKTAAVSDFTPIKIAKEKIKKVSTENNFILELTKTQDILKYLGENKPANQILCGFSMETENLIENSTKKLYNKNLDYIVANNLKIEGAGFGTDTNIATIISKKENKSFEKISKFELANEIINYIKEHS